MSRNSVSSFFGSSIFNIFYEILQDLSNGYKLTLLLKKSKIFSFLSFTWDFLLFIEYGNEKGYTYFFLKKVVLYFEFGFGQ